MEVNWEKAMDGVLAALALGLAGISVYDGNEARLVLTLLVAALCIARIVRS